MKIITEPTVTVLSAPTFFPHPKYELPEHAHAAESLIAHAGKGCYDSYGKDGRSVAEHIDSLIASGHGSVLEHANVSLFIEGISRGCSHEIVRHRHFSYSQRSTRYTAEDDAAIVLDPYYTKLYDKLQEVTGLPDELSMDESALIRSFLQSCADSIGAYRQQVMWLMEQNPEHMKGTALRKWARGKARQLLPHALETRMTMTGNLRAWRDFIEKRASPFAEAEIQRLAHMIFHTLYKVAPTVFADFLLSNTGLQPIHPRV